MLGLSKRTEYALIALGYLVARPESCCPAREIASAYELPQALLMNLLKDLHRAGWLQSTRGTKGGYRIIADLTEMTLYDLIEVIDRPVELVACVNDAHDCESVDGCRISATCPIRQPLQALHQKLVRFLKEVKVADLLVSGRKIDVLLESVGTTSDVGANA